MQATVMSSVFSDLYLVLITILAWLVVPNMGLYK